MHVTSNVSVLPTQIAAVVSEKELGLKQALRTMGMKDGAYWASWALWEVTLAFVVANSIVIYGKVSRMGVGEHCTSEVYGNARGVGVGGRAGAREREVGRQGDRQCI